MKKFFNSSAPFIPNLFICVLVHFTSFSQSTNCGTATSVTLNNGNVCVNGTTVGAITDNTFYGNCNPSPVTVNLVWYTYVTNGSVNDFTINPGTLTNAEIIIYSGGCPTDANAILETCTTATGSNTLNTTWGFPAGTQVWVGMASIQGTEGTFQFCINSQPPAPNPGNTCALAIQICDTNTFTQTTMSTNSSGQTPDCFGNPAQRDIWFKFTVSQSGTLAWKCTPINGGDEFDWALWDITNGCPPANLASNQNPAPAAMVCCNYNYAGGSANGFGMLNVSNNSNCGTSAASPLLNAEFSPTTNVTCGQTYAIQISNYSNSSNGFTFDWTGSTMNIASNSVFTASPTQVCGNSMTVNFNNTSTGACIGQVWDFGDNSATYTGTTPPSHTYTTPGTYAITAGIGGICPSTAVQYVQLLAPLAADLDSVPTGCSGICAGEASVATVTGGNGVYTYLWSNGSTTTALTGLCVGNYSVTVSNAACGTSIAATTDVTSNAVVPVIAFSANNPACGSSNGTITVSPTGGTTPYTYIWNNGQTTQTATGLSAGGYFVTITDFNGCTNDSDYVLNTTPSITLTATPDSVFCNGGNNGTATATASAGTTPYTYLWNNGQTTQTATGLIAGNYSVTVNDNSGCQSNISVTVNEPIAITLTTSFSNVTCQGGNDGTASASANGGVTPFTFLWDNGETSQNIDSLSAATYFVTVTDAKNCKKTATVVINDGAPNANATISQVGPFCIPDSSAVTLTAVTSGGTWSGSGITNTSTGVFDPFAAGSGNHDIIYSINTVCGDTDTVSITVNATPNATINPVSSLCTADSSLTITVATNGGVFSGTGITNNATGTFNPSVSGAGNFTITYNITLNGCSASDTATIAVNQSLDAAITPAGPFCDYSPAINFTAANSGGVWSGIGITNASTGTFDPATAGAGNYDIIYSINTACADTDTVSITVNATPNATINPVSSLCTADSSVTITVATNGGTFSGTGITNNFTGTFNPSVSGSGSFTITYDVTVNGCYSSDTETITVNQSMDASITPAGPFCVSSPPVNLTAVTGGGIWSGTGITNSSSGTFDPSASGTGTFTVTYSINTACGDIDSIAISVSDVVINSTVADSVSCNGLCNGSITLNAVGASSFSIDNGVNYQTGNVFNNLCAGNYLCVVQNAGGCADSVQVNVNEPLPLSLSSFLSNNATCSDSCNGWAVVVPIGGTPDYTFLWTSTNGSPPIGAGQGTAGLTQLCAGTYNLSVTDLHGCAATVDFTITKPADIVAFITSVQTLCADSCNGSATVLAGNGNYSYLWDANAGSQTDSTATGLCAGNYLVTITDGNNCQKILPAAVSQPLPVSVNATGSDTICIGQSAIISANANGGSGSYSYFWSTADSGNFQTVTPGNDECFYVTATDGNGCKSAPEMVCIYLYQPVQIIAGPDQTICPNDLAALNATIFNGSGGSSYQWQGGQTTQNINTVIPGTFPDTVYYWVIGKNDCPGDTDSVMITFHPIPTPVITPPDAMVCLGEAISFNSNPMSNVTCIWSMGDGTIVPQCGGFPYTYQNPGTYSINLTVTTTDGCPASASPPATVIVNPNPAANFNYLPENPTIVNTLVNFTNASSGQITAWNWTFFSTGNTVLGTSPDINPSFTFPPDSGLYPVNLQVTTTPGSCIDDTTIYIYIDNEYSLYIPNAFTPNGDGVNDFFPPKGLGINPNKFKLYIFDRWGDLIFESHDLNDPWDGTAREQGGKEIVKQDVYVWKIETEEATRSKQSHKYTGHVTLLKGKE